jgi:hypothetical protein
MQSLLRWNQRTLFFPISYGNNNIQPPLLQGDVEMPLEHVYNENIGVGLRISKAGLRDSPAITRQMTETRLKNARHLWAKRCNLMALNSIRLAI